MTRAAKPKAPAMNPISIKLTGPAGAGKTLLMDRVIGPALKAFDLTFSFDEAQHEMNLYLTEDDVRMITGKLDAGAG